MSIVAMQKTPLTLNCTATISRKTSGIQSSVVAKFPWEEGLKLLCLVLNYTSFHSVVVSEDYMFVFGYVTLLLILALSNMTGVLFSMKKERRLSAINFINSTLVSFIRAMPI